MSGNGWMKYVIASVLIHGAVLSIPAAMKAPRSAEPIEVFMIGSVSPPAAGGGTQGGGPKTMARSAGPPRAEHKQVRVQPKAPPMARREELPAAQAIRTPGVEPVAPAAPATPQETETGVAVASASGNAGPASLGTASGSGGSSGGGSGTGSGGGGGSSSGNGSGIGAGFGTPGGPRFLHRAVPEYPYLARRRKKEGSVLLMVTIDDAGKLTKTEVVETSDQMFVGPSLEAVKKSTFLPAERDGRPVACKALLPIRFSLTE